MTPRLVDVVQGSDEWRRARCGLLTASTIGQLITPARVQPADNDAARRLIKTLAAERITGHVEEGYTSRDMERGTLDEPFARNDYARIHQCEVRTTGLLIRDTLGYSPDGLVGDVGLIEIKSRNQHAQVDVFLNDEVPAANQAQLQAGLWVTGRAWIDYVSYSGGMPLYVKRVYPIPKWQDIIPRVATYAEAQIESIITKYRAATDGLDPVKRIDHYADIEVHFS